MLIYAYTGINVTIMINLQINYLTLKGKESGIRFTAIPFQIEFLRPCLRDHVSETMSQTMSNLRDPGALPSLNVCQLPSDVESEA